MKLKSSRLVHWRLKSSSFKKLIYMWFVFVSDVLSYEYNFDKRGVIYVLGRNFGLRDWRNPAFTSSETGVKVTWSGCGSGKPEDLLEYFKPKKCHTSSQKNSWWRVDLGEKYSLLPTHYTLRRSKPNRGVLINWELQGLFEEEWKTLRKHTNSQWGRGSSLTRTWPIEGKWGPIRCFKIVQTDVNSVGTHVIFLSGFELYGVLFENL